LRITRWGPVRDLEAGMQLARAHFVPTWQRLRGYGGCLILHAPDDDAVLFVSFWHREEDEVGSIAAIRPKVARLAEVWREAETEHTAYQVAVWVRTAIQPQAGAWVRSIEWDRMRPEAEVPIIQDWEDGLVPMFQHRPGFQGALLATNPATGQVVGASFWEDHATYEAARPGAMQVVADFVEKHALRERARLTLRMLLTDVPRGVVL